MFQSFLTLTDSDSKFNTSGWVYKSLDFFEIIIIKYKKKSGGCITQKEWEDNVKNNNINNINDCIQQSYLLNYEHKNKHYETLRLKDNYCFWRAFLISTCK